MLRAFGGGNFQHDVAALFIQRSQALLLKQRTGTADEAGPGVLQQHTRAQCCARTAEEMVCWYSLSCVLFVLQCCL